MKLSGLLVLLAFSMSVQAQEMPFKVPEDHLRIGTWNIKYLGDRKPLRTDEQLEKLASRIKELDFAVIALQEIQSNKRINDLVGLLGSSWKINPKAGWVEEPPSELETCLLWDTSKVKCLALQAWNGGIGYKSRPPYSGVFQPVEEGGEPFVVISIHAYPGKNKKAKAIRKQQGGFYRQLVLDMLDDATYPKSILLMGDFNGKPGRDPHTDIQPKAASPMLHLVGKSDKKGTMACIFNADIDHVYATDRALSRIRGKMSYVVRPKFYKESLRTFNKVYSDHLPVFVDFIPYNMEKSKR